MDRSGIPSRASWSCPRRSNVSFHFIVRFEPIAGKEPEFRRELLRVVEADADMDTVFKSIQHAVQAQSVA